MVSHHYVDNKNCDFEKHARVTAIEQIRCYNRKDVSAERKMEILKRREIFWQNKLQTFKDDGKNKREG